MTTPSLLPADLDDWAAAACAEADPEMFFPQPGPAGLLATRRAVTLCRSCPLVESCLERGRDEPPGVWGGLLPDQRAALRRREELTGRRVPRPRLQR